MRKVKKCLLLLLVLAFAFNFAFATEQNETEVTIVNEESTENEESTTDGSEDYSVMPISATDDTEVEDNENLPTGMGKVIFKGKIMDDTIPYLDTITINIYNPQQASNKVVRLERVNNYVGEVELSYGHYSIIPTEMEHDKLDFESKEFDLTSPEMEISTYITGMTEEGYMAITDGNNELAQEENANQDEAEKIPEKTEEEKQSFWSSILINNLFLLIVILVLLITLFVMKKRKEEMYK